MRKHRVLLQAVELKTLLFKLGSELVPATVSSHVAIGFELFPQPRRVGNKAHRILYDFHLVWVCLCKLGEVLLSILDCLLWLVRKH